MTAHDRVESPNVEVLTGLGSDDVPAGGDDPPTESGYVGASEQESTRTDAGFAYVAGDEELYDALEYFAQRQDRVLAEQGRLSEEFRVLVDHFERLAKHVGPLLARQFDDTKERVRVLEWRLRNRQERPLLIRIAVLLADVRRLEASADIKAHVEEALMDALSSVGYQEIGREGDQFDPLVHEPVAGAIGKTGVVKQVFSRGLACYGDVLIKAKVDVAPATDVVDGEGGLPG